ncbi:MAG: hypothetical protein BWX96_00622 [Bacteroidetes bacterium ADurb.Bin145]|jgi:hypothetical protein|nr:MAG: hypothetical protein BWX96_00622 [Bacteroidetes bacterium ADurb.Bin145]
MGKINLYSTNPKDIGRWAINNFIKIHQKEKCKSEEEIAKFLFSQRYKSIFVSKELKILANENMPFITSIPVLVSCIINMQSEGGRTDKWKDLYYEGLGEMIQIYSKEKPFPCELVKIIGVTRKISEMVQKSSLSEESSDIVKETIMDSLIFRQGYRQYKNENELINYISAIISEFEKDKKFEKKLQLKKRTELFEKYDHTDNLSRKNMIADLESIGYDKESATLYVDEYILKIYPKKHYLFLEMNAEKNQ